jgi:predicted RecB family endonuclease
MANAVYTGADGSITLSTPEGAEGAAAQAVIDDNAMISVGRATGVTIEVTSDVKAFHEIGQRYASELRPGNIAISGTINRAYINGALIKLMLGRHQSARCQLGSAGI